MYTKQEVMEFVRQEGVRFVKLAFCDVFGNQKNISILPEELGRAFEDGISFDASAVRGFGAEVKSDLLLFPDPATLMIIPWRSENGLVVRMFCDIRYPDGAQFESDCRYILKKAVETAARKGISCNIGAEFEFYLFKTDENGDATDIPFDNASYMDIAPEDRGENVRREICFTLTEMGIQPESSHHEEGPGQNEIDFKFSEPLTAADNAVTFKAVVKTIAMLNGLYATFDPKPLPGRSGNGLHINISVNSQGADDYQDSFMAGILSHVREMTAFLNPEKGSYSRLGKQKAPRYITWSPENRSQLIRIPAPAGGSRRIELRSPDPTTNPYIAYALLLYAGMEGIEKRIQPPPPTNENLVSADSSVRDALEALPASLEEAVGLARRSKFIKTIIPEAIIEAYAGLLTS